MVRLSAVILLLLALVCLSMGDNPSNTETTGVSNGNSTDPSHGGDQSGKDPVPAPINNSTSPVHNSSSSEPPHNSSSSNSVSENESSSSSHENVPFPAPDPNSDSNEPTESSSSDEHGKDSDSDESEHSGGDESEDSDDDDSDDSDDHGKHHFDNDYKPNSRYVHVRIIFVLSLEDIISLSNHTYDLREAVADIFNISEKYVSIHFRLHGEHDESSELAESSFGSDSDEDESESESESESKDGENSGNSGESENDAGSSEDASSSSEEHPNPMPVKPIRKDRKDFEMIVDIRVPVESAPTKITTSTAVTAGVNGTLSNPDSDLAKVLTASGAQNVRTATSPVTTVTPTNNTVTPNTGNATEAPTSAPTSVPTTKPNIIEKVLGSGSMVTVSAAMLVMSVMAALVF